MVQVDPARPGFAAPRGRRRWALGLRGLMVAVLVAGAGLAWPIRLVAVRRDALATIRAAGGRVTFRDPDRGWWGWLADRTGSEFCRTVAVVFIEPARPELAGPGRAAVYEAVGRLGAVDGVEIADGGITAADLAALESAMVGGLSLQQAIRPSDALIAQIRRSRRIRTLTLNAPDGELPRSALAAAGDLAQLEGLGLWGLPPLRPADLASIRRLKHLKHLTLGRHLPADNAWLDGLQALPTLEMLHLPGARLADADVSRLVARAPRLVRLAFDGSAATDRGIEALAGLPGLQTLVVGGGSPPGRLTDASLAAVGRLGSLKVLDLAGGRFTAAGLDAIAGRPLFQLRLDSIEPGADAALGRVLGRRSFFLLGLHGPGVTDATLPLLAGRLGSGAVLDLSRSAITDAGMRHLAPVAVGALFLNDTAITDAGLATLAAATTAGSVVARGTRVTPAGAAAFRAARPGTRLHLGDEGP